MNILDALFSRAPDFFRAKWLQGMTKIGKRINYGRRPYNYDWDVLLILDACRWDLWQKYAPTHSVTDRFDSVESVYSCASSSDEWVLKTFGEAADEDIAETVYVTANAYTYLLDFDRFYDVEEVWKYARDPESGTVFPEAVTNEAIRAYREAPDKRYVVHYLQPHAPFLHCLNRYSSLGENRSVWKELERGRFDRNQIIDDYGQNLLAILDHVETILDNINGTVLITADHGNFVGEWGLYGHPSWVPLPAVKRVPWAIAQGSNQHRYEVLDKDEITTTETEEPSVNEHLRQLGYIA